MQQQQQQQRSYRQADEMLTSSPPRQDVAVGCSSLFSVGGCVEISPKRDAEWAVIGEWCLTAGQ